MVNVPVFGTPGSQLPRIPISDAQQGIGFHAVAKLGQPGGRAYTGLVPLEVMDELLGSSTFGTAAEVIALGARGTIWDVQVGGGTYEYVSDQAGGAYPYLCRSDLGASGHLLNTGDGTLEIVINYGQSWVTNVSAIGALTPLILESTELNVVFAPVNVDGTFSSGIGLPGSYTNVNDFRGVSNANTAGNQLGQFTSISRVRQMRAAGLNVKPIGDICPAYPGLIWPGLEPGTGPWTALIAMVAFSNAIAAKYGLIARFRMCRWTDGTEANTGGAPTEYQDLTSFLAALDALNLNADGELITVFGDQTPATDTNTSPSLGSLDQVQFALDHPTRYVVVGPRYPYTTQDYIHHDALGSAHLSEIRGLVEMAVLEQGLTWTVMHITAYYIQGTTITIDINQPLENFFGQLVLNTTYIEADVQFGLRLQQNGAFIALSNITIVSNTRITMTTAVALATTDTIVFSNAFYGPGRTPGTHSGAWSNIAMAMAPSLYFPGESIFAWLAISLVTLSAANFIAPPALPAVTAIALSGTTVQANQLTTTPVGVFTATVTGTVGDIVWSLDNSAGGYFNIVGGNTLQAIAAFPVGTFVIVVRATPAAGQPLTMPFTIIAS